MTLLLPPRQLCRDELPVAWGDMRRPPARAFLWGVVPPGPYVAIVGRRTPTRGGAESARRLARGLAEEGVTILSGGAAGIDAAAHQGALDAGGKTLVVAPAWLTRPYPSENEELFRAVVERGGGYLTLVEEGVTPFNPVFFERNEALVALCQILVVGECAHRSGAKNAVAHAERLGRPLYVLPSLYGNTKGAGSNSLLLGGARPVLSPAELLTFLDAQGTYDNPRWWQRRRETREREEARRRAARRASSRTPDQEGSARQPKGRGGGKEKDRVCPSEVGRGVSVAGEVRRALRGGARNVDEICEVSGVSAAVAQHELLLLLLRGEVREDERGLLRYVARPDERA